MAVTSILAIPGTPNVNTQMVTDIDISCVRLFFYPTFIVNTTGGLAGLVIKNTGEDGGSLPWEISLMCPGFWRNIIPYQEVIDEISHMWIEKEVSCLIHCGQLNLHGGVSLQLQIMHFTGDWFKWVWGELIALSCVPRNLCMTCIRGFLLFI